MRGHALAGVMALVSLLLLAGLALGTLSTLALSLARQSYLEARASLAARSAVARFVAEMEERRVDLGRPVPPDLALLFPDTEIVPGCRIRFDPGRELHSTDNSLSEYPRAGTFDRGESRSVPPFTVELVLLSEAEGHRATYRVLLQREWPYAAYCAEGPIILSSLPAEWSEHGRASATRVAGDVYCGWDASRGLYGDPRLDLGDSPAMELARLELSGLSPGTIYHPVAVGPPTNHYGRPPERLPWTASPVRVAGLPEAALATLWRVPRPPPRRRVALTRDRGNRLHGDAHFAAPESAAAATVWVDEGNEHRGGQRHSVQVEDPFERIRVPGMADFPFQSVDLPRAAVRLEMDLGLAGRTPISEEQEISLLTRDLRLSPDENGAGGPAGTHYIVPGNLGNRVVLRVGPRRPHPIPGAGRRYGPLEEGDLVVAEYGAGIRLQDCVLLVEGDLDLAGTGSGRAPALEGTNATLIVEGTLVLSDGRLDSRDQGMVIYARQVVTRASGDYRGLMVASESLTVLPGREGLLRVRGGVVSRGRASATDLAGVVLRSVDLEHDPRYLKVLHGAGRFRLTGWEKR